MPLFFQENINEISRLAVWHITEPEQFFLKKVSPQNEINHPHKRLQHLAGRYLLQLLEPAFPVHLISIAESKKPLLPDNEFHFSISHCGDFAAAIISKYAVGIDVELITPKVVKLKNKFLDQGEFDIISKNFQVPQIQLLTLFWSAKESIFKWYGKGKVDFKQNIQIENFHFNDQKGILNAAFIKEETSSLKLNFIFIDSLCIVWLLT